MSDERKKEERETGDEGRERIVKEAVGLYTPCDSIFLFFLFKKSRAFNYQRVGAHLTCIIIVVIINGNLFRYLNIIRLLCPK